MNNRGAVTEPTCEVIGNTSYKILGKVVFVEKTAPQQVCLEYNDTGKNVSTGRPSDKKVLVLCDHASYRVPPMMGYVSREILLDHHGWDIGALSVARVLAHGLSSPLIYSNFSRLLIDPNRREEAKDLIREDLSISLNVRMDVAKRAQRIALFYDPYHREIGSFLDSSSGITFILAVHTFTPVWGGNARVWDAGLIYDVERSGDVLCAEFIMNFLRNEGFLVGDNQPYPALLGDSLARHAAGRGLVGVGIEIKNSLVRDTRAQKEWGERLARGVRGWLNSTQNRIAPSTKLPLQT